MKLVGVVHSRPAALSLVEVYRAPVAGGTPTEPGTVRVCILGRQVDLSNVQARRLAALLIVSTTV